MRNLYFDIHSHVEIALTHSKNLKQVLITWLDSLSDTEERESGLACAFITLLEPVIDELNKIDQLRGQVKVQDGEEVKP